MKASAFFAIAVLFLAGLASSSHALAQLVNCDDRHVQDLQPPPTGPYGLATVYCHSISRDPFQGSNLLVSPDAQKIAFLDYDRRAIHVVSLASRDAPAAYTADLGVFESLSGPRGRPSFQWSADSQFMRAATQTRDRHGWALAPIRLLHLEGGDTQPLPSVRHEAGPLDGIQWIRDGRALALIGARGGYYRPEHEDSSPTLAMVSTDTGKLLDATRLENAFIRVAEATVLSDGRMRAVYGGKRLFVWTQGEAAAPLPIPFANQMTAAISPDGGFLLVANDLRVAWTCTRGGKCWQGPPVKGIVAILYELPAGREVWTLRSNADEPSPKAPLPEISPDGAYALVGLPSSFQVQRFAVVSMKDGTIVQTMPAPGDHYNFGFARDGDVVWTHDHGVTAIYQTRHDVR